MATYGAIIEGLKIIAAHENKGLDAEFGAVGHDILYAGGAAEYMRPVEASAGGRRLKALGWHVDMESETWAHFTGEGGQVMAKTPAYDYGYCPDCGAPLGEDGEYDALPWMNRCGKIRDVAGILAKALGNISVFRARAHPSEAEWITCVAIMHEALRVYRENMP